MRRLFVVLLLATAISPATAATIAIIGTGDVAGALGPEFAAQGHRIVYGSRDPARDSVNALVERTGHGAAATTQAEAAKGADIVVLAVPGMLAPEIVKDLGELSGKIIIDPTNPLKRTDHGFELGVDTSNAQIIQAEAPGAYVVKAFNTLNYRIMIDPQQSGGPVSIPLVGDSADAKATVAKLVEGMGLEPIDLGGVENAHWVEGMLILWINNRVGGRQPFDYYLRRTP